MSRTTIQLATIGLVIAACGAPQGPVSDESASHEVLALALQTIVDTHQFPGGAYFDPRPARPEPPDWSPEAFIDTDADVLDARRKTGEQLGLPRGNAHLAAVCVRSGLQFEGDTLPPPGWDLPAECGDEEVSMYVLITDLPTRGDTGRWSISAYAVGGRMSQWWDLEVSADLNEVEIVDSGSQAL